MAVLQTDIQTRLSGGALNADPEASLGGAMSDTLLTDAALHNLFDLIQGDQSGDGDVDYRCIYVLNDSAQTFFGANIFFTSGTASPNTSLAIALAGEGVNGGAENIADEGSPPAGEAFEAAASEAAALIIGDLQAGESHAIWVRRTVTAGAAALDLDNTSFTTKGQTGE